MKFTKEVEYAIRYVKILKQHIGKVKRIEDIAKENYLSHTFLERIHLKLKNAGITGSKRGTGGGVFLIKFNTNLYDITTAFDKECKIELYNLGERFNDIFKQTAV